ncbi:MAG: GNAT family N-acetyltransferase [Bacteroidia bacterium]
MNLTIRQLKPGEVPPYHLLMLADPSRKQIDKNLDKGLVYLAFIKDQLVGTFVIKKLREEVFEVVNIAVKESYRQQGLGKQLLEAAEIEIRLRGGSYIEIGTGNSSLNQLMFYQKSGFRMKEIWVDFFTKNYEEPIEENGIPCLDMVRLYKALD